MSDPLSIAAMSAGAAILGTLIGGILTYFTTARLDRKRDRRLNAREDFSIRRQNLYQLQDELTTLIAHFGKVVEQREMEYTVDQGTITKANIIAFRVNQLLVRIDDSSLDEAFYALFADLWRILEHVDAHQDLKDLLEAATEEWWKNGSSRIRKLLENT